MFFFTAHLHNISTRPVYNHENHNMCLWYRVENETTLQAALYSYGNKTIQLHLLLLERNPEARNHWRTVHGTCNIQVSDQASASAQSVCGGRGASLRRAGRLQGGVHRQVCGRLEQPGPEPLSETQKSKVIHRLVSGLWRNRNFCWRSLTWSGWSLL